MTIEEVRNEKLLAEQEIAKIISDLKKKTECYIKDGCFIEQLDSGIFYVEIKLYI